MFNKSALEPSVRTHPGLVEAAVLAAHAEGLDGWRRLLRHQQSLLQLDLLLQLHQHGRLHAVPEGHNGGYMCSFVFWNAAPSSSFTHLETMRPISSRQRQTCRGSLCSTEGKKTKKTKKTTAINKLLINDPKKQLPLRLSLQREEKRRDEARKKLSC